MDLLKQFIAYCGGAIEMELSRHLKEMSGKIVGKEQFFWKAFARMFEVR
ncbi:unnamed protein product [Anisakis simplex]|uniref:Uncharacterized protein n=1 Tax=Anisakis simplex TaxID=6269 RepID=A0A0M3JKZ2_ANISI|nr:unnamed protein product [Anisakis simplex]